MSNNRGFQEARTHLLPNMRKMTPSKDLPNRRLKWLIAALVVAIFLVIYLPSGLAILYNYYWWIRFHSTVKYAAPVTVPEGAEPVVPKILHQTWKNKDIPDKWLAARQSCIDRHPDYEYRLWTDEDAEKLISDKFPWFLETYKGYPHHIQRADALRYFVLYEYGGIYLDLDVECLKSLDYLRYFKFTAPKTYPIGVSNDVMVAQPKDDFSLRLINNLISWKKWFFVKYATVMFSTGPMFVTVQFSLYDKKDDFTVLPADVYGKYELTSQAYLKHLHGSSWHGNDAKYVFWLEHHGIFAACMGAVLLATALTALLVHRHWRHAAVPPPYVVLPGIVAQPTKPGMLSSSWVALAALMNSAQHRPGITACKKCDVV